MAQTNEKAKTRKAAPAKPAARKRAVTTKRAGSKKTTSPAPAPERPRAREAPSGISPEQRLRMVQEAAYYISERRGFRGDSGRDWLEAEAQIDAMLLERHGQDE